jgi:hypothetical protein
MKKNWIVLVLIVLPIVPGGLGHDLLPRFRLPEAKS